MITGHHFHFCSAKHAIREAPARITSLVAILGGAPLIGKTRMLLYKDYVATTYSSSLLLLWFSSPAWNRGKLKG